MNLATMPCQPMSATLLALIERARTYKMTKAERDAQRRSWVRGEMMLEHPEMTAAQVDAIIESVEGRP